MNCTSIYSMLIVDPAMKMFILDNCILSSWVILPIISSTIQNFNITLVYSEMS